MVESSQGSQVKSASFRESSHVTPGKEHGGESTKDLVSKCTQMCGHNVNGRSCAKTVLVKVFLKGRPSKAVKV